MKKIDKLTLKSFLSPFILTTSIVVFIFLMRFIMLYFDDFVGKNLGLEMYSRLFFYFILMSVPISLPLSILLAALMCFGNLGEHSELTAIKSAGIPLTRVILPTLIVALTISVGSFFYNNYVTPWANLKGYSLLWDIKTAKLTLNIQEGIFYAEIPGYRIKVKKKYNDEKSLKGVMVYDHSSNNGNRTVTVADSGRMYTINNESYLVFELFNGQNYSEYKAENGSYNDTPFMKNKFSSNRIVLSLSSFGLKRTDENQFKYHEYMKNISELNSQIDSTNKLIDYSRKSAKDVILRSHNYQFRKIDQLPILSDNKLDTLKYLEIKPGKWIEERIKNLNKVNYQNMQIIESAISDIYSTRGQINASNITISSKQKEAFHADVEKWHKFTLAFACFIMFMIGASLGTIIKKGGFGIPVLLAVSFFILMYILMQLGDKYAKEGVWPVIIGVWMPDAILLSIALFLLQKATNDAQLFANPAVMNLIDKIKRIKLKKKKIVELTD